MPRHPTSSAARAEQIEHAIQVVRGQRILLDADLARRYGVTTAALNQAVRRTRTGFRQTLRFS